MLNRPDMPDVLIRRLVSTTVPVDSQVAADFVRHSLAGMYPGDSHCALRVWGQRRCGSTSRQLDPDRSAARLGRSIPRISREQRHVAAPGGIWLHGPACDEDSPRPRNQRSEAVSLVVAGVGFEPT